MVEKLIELANFSRADEVTLQYLEYLSGEDTSILFIKPCVFRSHGSHGDEISVRKQFWADPLRKHGAQLPRSSEFFRANFPEVSLIGPTLQ